jgi:broad specificity phosphatase PhoE
MILLRHGQSEFNLAFTATKRDPGIPDPKLTPHGEEQALAAALALGDAGIKRIICSPYTRALQTVAPIAERLRVPVTITPTVRERYAFSCDIGTPRTHLQRDWPHLDFGHIDEIWWPAIEEPDAQIEARAQLFRGEMATLPGWQEELDAVRSEHDLPTNARRYVDRIAELLDRPVSIVSVGPDRAQTIIRGPEATRRPWLSPQPAKA